MPEYNQQPLKVIKAGTQEIASFVSGADTNMDLATVNSFGEEWKKFSFFSEKEIKNAGNQYFDIVNEKHINKDSVVLDLGCGTGRWSKYLAPKVKFIEAVDPSDAVLSAARLNADKPNIRVTNAGVDNIPFDDNTFDFMICLGVLHHIPDTEKALQKGLKKLKNNGYLLLYLYYALDNRGIFYKFIFSVSTLFRKTISKLPSKIKLFVCDLMAVFVYMPAVLASKATKVIFKNNWYSYIPLSYYHDKSFNIIRNDALDRFGTPLEQRFTRVQIEKMMKDAGLSELVFSVNAPYWHVIGKKSS